MKDLIGFLIVLLLLSASGVVQAQPVLVIAGKLTDADGQVLSRGFTIRVTNETNGIQASGISGTDGSYTVTLVAWPPDHTVAAEPGDELRVVVLNAEDTVVGIAEHTLTTAEIEQAVVVLDVPVEPTVTPIPVLAVSGTIRDEAGDSAGAGWSVSVANESRALRAAGITDASGKYALVLVNVEPDGVAAQVGDKIVVTVQDAGGQRQTTQRHTLTAADVQNAHATVSVQVRTVPNDPPQFLRVGDQVAASAQRLSFEIKEGEVFRLPLQADDPDGDPLSYSASPMPADARFEGSDFIWTPGFDTVDRVQARKTLELTLLVSDGKSQATQPIALRVQHVPNAASVRVDAVAQLAAIPGSTTPVTITVHDAQDQPVTDALITLEHVPEVGSVSTITPHTDGTHTATYTAGTVLGEVEFIATTENGVQGKASIELVPGPAVALHLTLDPSELLAGGKGTATVTVTALDAAEHTVRADDATVTYTPKFGQLGSLVRQSDGSQQATYTAGDSPGVLTFTAEAGGLQATAQLVLTEEAEPSATRSEIEIDSPMKAGETVTVRVRLLTAGGTPIPDVATQVSLEGTHTFIETDPTDADGDTQADLGQLKQAGSYAVQVRVLPDGPTIERAPVLLVIPAEPFKLMLDAPARAERGDQVVIHLQVEDRFQNPISDVEITLHTSLGKVTSSAIPQAEGVYAATFLSEVTGHAEVTAQIPGGPAESLSLEVMDTRAVIHSGEVSPRMAKAGDTITIRAYAEPGGQMHLTIQGVPGAQKRSMFETEPGVYEGTYEVPPGINVADARVTLDLQDMEGNLGKHTLESTLTIDTTQPPAPTDLRVEGGGITAENAAEVVVTAHATPGRAVTLRVVDVGESEATADEEGQVVWHLDAADWPNGEYLFEAAETPDEVGNAGTITRLRVVKDDRPQTSLLFVRISPAEIPFAARAVLEVTIGFTLQPPATVDIEVVLSPSEGDDRTYALTALPPDTPGEVAFEADVLGPWQYRVTWPGNTDHRAVEREGTFSVVAAAGNLTLEAADSSVKSGQPIRLTGELDPPRADQEIQLLAIAPNVSAWQQMPAVGKTSDMGRFEIQFVPEQSGLWQFQVVWQGLKDAAGAYQYARTLSPSVEVDVLHPTGKVVIAVGGDPTHGWEETFFKLGRYVYDSFLRRGFPAENVRFLSTVSKGSVDTPLNLRNLEDVLLQWGPEELTPDENLYVYLLSDNLREKGFILQRGVFGTERLEKSQVHEWLEALNRRKVNVVLFMESCYSGEYIQPATQPLQARRVVITSASRYTPAIIRRTDSFSRRFFTRLLLRQDLAEALTQTRLDMKDGLFLNAPQLDADGDGFSNEREDFALLEGLYLGDPALDTEGDEPAFFEWSPAQTLAEGVHSALIEAIIQGGGVTSTAEIFAPGQLDIADFDSWEALEGELVELVGDENTGYRATYDRFTGPGTYLIFLYAENADGFAIPAMTTVTVPGAKIEGDANENGCVDVEDLVLVGRHFGETPPSDPRADVNQDGTVDVGDLIRIGQHFDECVDASTAPLLVGISPLEAVQVAIAALNTLGDMPGRQIALEQLRAWLGQQVSEARLLPNYPNPCNPETWIPFQLTQQADVTIHIYDMQGHPVRMLNLGQREAGFYVDRDHAAHWDGRNAAGEYVSSGVYWAVMETSEGRFVRRMVVRK